MSLSNAVFEETVFIILLVGVALIGEASFTEDLIIVGFIELFGVFWCDVFLLFMLLLDKKCI